MITTYLQQLEAELADMEMSDEKRKNIAFLAQKIQKQSDKDTFLHRRSQSDKAISINILNATVLELEEQKKRLDESNQFAEAQKQLLRTQSEQLLLHLESLEMSYAELEQFAYIASHDLKSPLRNMGAYAQLLQKRYSSRLDETGLEFLDYIVNGAKQMNDIITDLLEYSRLDKNREFTETDLNNIVELVKVNLREQIAETGAMILIENKLPKIPVSKSSIIQLFQNLLENALKFKGETAPIIRIRAHQIRPSVWQIEVEDNGLGLEETFQEKAFLPFQRVAYLDRPGSGMGLAICHKTVKLHGGRIWYQKNEIAGTTFYFTIAKMAENRETIGRLAKRTSEIIGEKII